MIKFACIVPHPPLLLPGKGEASNKKQVKQTIAALNTLAEKLARAKPETIVISSPHSDWGFDVPLHFLAKNFKGEIESYLIGQESPKYYFDKGKELARELKKEKAVALIASGDLSHCLKQEGPYGFHPDGPKFDKTLIECLNKKDINTLLKLDEKFPNAAECGLRSFAFMLGILQAAAPLWQAQVLSYEAPFGVGYLVASLQIKNEKVKNEKLLHGLS